MSAYVGDTCMDGNLETLKNTKEKIKKNFNIQEYGKVKNFLRVYYEWICDAKCTYSKMTTEKDVNKLVEGYKNYIGSDAEVHKTTGAPGTTLIKSDLEEPYNIDKDRSFVGQLMWYNTKVRPDVANASRELAVHRSHPRP